MPRIKGDDENKTWRLFYRLDPDAIIILEVTEKKTQATSKATIQTCQKRLKSYESHRKQKKG